MSKKKRKFNWRGALAGLGQHMQQQSLENQRAAREQQRMQAQLQNQMALEQLRAQREAERYKTLDARAERDYQFRQKQAEAQRAYQENMWKAQQENYWADNQRADRELQWKIDQAAAQEAQRKAMEQEAIETANILADLPLGVAPVPPGAPPPVGAPAAAAAAAGLPPVLAPVPGAAEGQAPPPTAPMGLPSLPIYQPFVAPQRPAQIDKPHEIEAWNKRLRDMQQAHDDAFKRELEIYKAQLERMKLEKELQGGGEDENADLTTGDLDFAMAIAQRQRDPLNKRKSLVAKLNDLYANNKGTQKEQEQIAALEQQIAELDKASGGAVPSPQEFYNLARAYKTGQIPPALAADTPDSGTLTSHPAARAALEQGENPDVVMRALEIMQQGR